MSLKRYYKDVRSDNLKLEISRGTICDASFVAKFGANFAVPSATEVTIWSEATTLNPFYTYPAAALQMTVQSTALTDDDGGVGANTIEIQGLDENYVPQKEIVTMNGTTSVNTANTYLRVFRMFVVTAGTDGKNAGKITIENGGTVYGSIVKEIDTNDNDQVCQTLMTPFTIPAGWEGYLYFVDAHAGNSRAVRPTLLFRNFGGVFQLKNLWPIFNNGVDVHYSPPLKLDEKSDIEMRVKNIDGSQTEFVTGTYSIILFKKTNTTPKLPWGPTCE